MFRPDRARRLELLILVGSIILAGDLVSTQKQTTPPNDLASPYETVRNWGTLPPGRTWRSTGAVAIDRDGISVWAIERCGSFSWQSSGRVSCAGSNLDPVLKFDPSGKTVTSFGGGRFIFPHRLHIDREGNVWVTDSRAATAAELKEYPDARGKGHTVVKFSPQGKVLMTLGTPGVAGDPPERLNEPCDVITMPNGDILVSEGHSGQSNKPAPTTVSRISQFSSDGKFIRSFGRLGSGPGEFKTPHAWRSTRPDACTSQTAATTGSRFSIGTSSSLPNGPSSAARATFRSPTACSTSQTRNRAGGTAPSGREVSALVALKTAW